MQSAISAFVGHWMYIKSKRNAFLSGEIGWWRLWQFQQERFPLLQHGPVLVIFSASAVCYSWLLLRSGQAVVSAQSFLIAALFSITFFLQLRIIDEVQDAEQDALLRPYRPIPRGLVSRRELIFLGTLVATSQLLIAYLLTPQLLSLLFGVWFFMWVSAREFFAAAWLKKHHVLYASLHMLIVVLIDLFATACQWSSAQSMPPMGLYWFLAASFFNGFVIEIGRKIKRSDEEEIGVDSYSARYGVKKALFLWVSAMFFALVSALMAANIAGYSALVFYLSGSAFVFSSIWSSRCWFDASMLHSKQLEVFSGVWVVLLYLGLGIVPYILLAL